MRRVKRVRWMAPGDFLKVRFCTRLGRKAGFAPFKATESKFHLCRLPHLGGEPNRRQKQIVSVIDSLINKGLPELDPIEYGWAYLKGHVLANHAPKDADERFAATKRGICKTRRQRDVLIGCIDHAPISFFN